MEKNIKISIGIFLALAASRFIPHPPNFTSLIALGFYVPLIFGLKFIFIVVASYFITDLIIGFHSTLFFTWGSVVLIGLLSNYFYKNIYYRVAGALTGAMIFFIVTIVWVLLLGFGSPIFLIGGFIFGKWVGTILVVFGLTIGSTLLYYFANFLIKDLIYKKFSSKFKYLTEKFKRNELAYFTLYRAVGGIPFFLQNLLPILFNVKIRNYFFGTIIGLTPQLFVGVSLGAGIDKIIQENEKLPSIWKMLKTPDIYFPLLGIILIFLLAIYFRKKFFKQ